MSSFSVTPAPSPRRGGAQEAAFTYTELESERGTHSDTFIIMPEGGWKEKWDMTMLVLILYSAATVPFRVCFDADAKGLLWLFEVTMSFCFLVDCAFSFRTAFFADGDWVTSPMAIAGRYLRGWFWIDAPSSLPLELLDLLSGGSAGGLALLRFLRMLRLLRLLRLLRIDEYLEQLEDRFELPVNPRVVDALMMTIKISFLAHVCGCFWYGISALTRTCSGEDESECTPTWYESYGGEDATVWQLYLMALYWSVMTLTTTGYGDIVPTNDVERSSMIVMMAISALTFSYMTSPDLPRSLHTPSMTFH